MAAPQIKATLLGDKDLEKDLLRLARRYGVETIRSPLHDAVYHALEPIEQQIRATTPVATGRLKRKIYRERFKSRNFPIIAGTGYRFRGKRDAPQAVTAGVAEFGSPTRRALRTVRGAFDQNRDKVMRIFTERFNIDFELQLRK